MTPAAKKKTPAKTAKRAPAKGKAKKQLKVDIKPERLSAILDGLRKAHPDAECALIHKSPWELVVATILSAQCTDVA